MSGSALCATMKALDCRMCMHWIYTEAHQGGATTITCAQFSLIQHGEMYVNISHHKDHGVSADSY